ncbi:MAG: hypothetical protein CFE46_17620 [Burkholderiales bacterium PBB6]|nr:MAG: hypothetical protein CFE46_17620 [Burkholderiales bacterium PBB6]
MIYKFKSKACADVIMLGPNGDRVLGLIGKQPGPRGIIEVSQMPAALEALQAAIAADEAVRAEMLKSAAEHADEANPDDDKEDTGASRAPVVSLRQRAWPLIDMMQRALGEQQAIVWGV